MPRTDLRVALVATACTVLVAIATAPAPAATITLVNNDGPNEGLNDPTPVAPVGGNPGTTLGAQRRNALQFAADIWSGVVSSGVEIRINATFDPLPCSSSFAVLGEGGATTVIHDFAGAPVANTWYPIALANALAGLDLDPGNNDVDTQFNSNLGTVCPSFPFYYGFDGNTGGATDLVAVAIHEIGHGLGFATFVDPSTGQRLNNLDDVFMRDLVDESTGKTWNIMTDAERQTSATDTGDLHWVGAHVIASSGSLTAGVGPAGHVHMFAPNPVQPGSSVSHWDTTVAPNEVMEPAYTGPIHDPHLAVQLLQDIGWTVSACGNGVIEGGETCDDGNTANGDGCSSGCRVENCFMCSGQPSVCSPGPNGSACDDGNGCTQTDTCLGGACIGANPVVCTPLDQCHVAGVCSTTSGQCSNPTKADGSACNDGDACTGPDTCLAGACQGLPNCIDDFLCYKVKVSSGTAKLAPIVNVGLVDAFDSLTVALTKTKHLCTPANDGDGTVDPATHLKDYQLKPISGAANPQRNLRVTNQLGTLVVDTERAGFLLVPATKDPNIDPPPPSGSEQVDHYECYKMKSSPGTPRFQPVQVSVSDQFTSPAKVFDVKKPALLCVPVSKNGSVIKHPSVQQLCYKVKGASGQPKHTPRLGLHVADQFGVEHLDTRSEDLLCLPSVESP